MESTTDDNFYPLCEEDLEAGYTDINPNLFSCGICYCDYDLTTDQVQVKMLDECKHTFCSECFTETFRSMIED